MLWVVYTLLFMLWWMIPKDVMFSRNNVIVSKGNEKCGCSFVNFERNHSLRKELSKRKQTENRSGSRKIRKKEPNATTHSFQSHNVKSIDGYGQCSKAPAKRSHHLNATDHIIVGRDILHAFDHLVATCCDMLRLENRISAHVLAHHVTTSTNVAWKIWPFSNSSQHHPTFRNTSQQGGQTHAACCTQQVAIRCVEMLRSLSWGLTSNEIESGEVCIKARSPLASSPFKG